METKDIDLTKCNNCRIKVRARYYDGEEYAATGRIFTMRDGAVFVESDNEEGDIELFCDGKISDEIVDFEIVPRDPETYKDWQVGDRVTCPDEKWNNIATLEVIFRSGELVALKALDGCFYDCYTCQELFQKGYRLVLTDIERQIIEEKKKVEWKPQDGDVFFVKTSAGNCFIFIKREDKVDDEIYCYAGFSTNAYFRFFTKVTCVCDRKSIRELRPATDEEKQRLFDTMAEGGKRWNAEKKVVEDIPKPCEFEKGEPVLVRDNGCVWKIGVFTKMRADYFQYGAMTNGLDECGYHFCIPYNERTMHLLGTSNDYVEE